MTIPHRLRLGATTLLFSLSLGCHSTSPGAQAAQSEQSVAPGINNTFLSENLDVQAFIDRFEGESREVAREQRGIVATLGLEPGMNVADVGAGTGLFLESLAGAVGKRGHLYEVDISPKFIEHLKERVHTERVAQASVVLTDSRSLDLPRASVDVVFVCDTYHHFEYPSDNLASIRRVLRPGGRLVIVDFDRIEGVTKDWLMKHVRAGKDVVRAEVEAAGFVFEDEPEVPGLSENYVLRFRRP